MNNQQDLPLNKEDAARFVPAIVGLMVYLGTLVCVFSLFLVYGTHLWESQLTTDLTIEIPTFDHEISHSLRSQVLEVVSRTPGVQRVSAVPQEEMVSLFHSLIGEDVSVGSLSLPILIDVSLDGKEKVDIRALEVHLKSISSSIHLVDHRAWQSHVLNLIHTGIFLSGILTCLILLAALLTTAFATRTSLLIHRQVIEILSLIGATNSYIAKQFQMTALTQGLIASSIGSFFAFVTCCGLFAFFKEGHVSALLNSSFLFSILSVFLLAPLIAAFCMMISARLVVMRALKA